MFWFHGGHGHWGWFAFGMVWMLVFWGAVVWLIVWGVRNLSGQPREQKRSSALDIAGERYARGEITKEQFEEIKRTLSA